VTVTGTVWVSVFVLVDTTVVGRSTVWLTVTFLVWTAVSVCTAVFVASCVTTFVLVATSVLVETVGMRRVVVIVRGVPVTVTTWLFATWRVTVRGLAVVVTRRTPGTFRGRNAPCTRTDDTFVTVRACPFTVTV